MSRTISSKHVRGSLGLLLLVLILPAQAQSPESSSPTVQVIVDVVIGAMAPVSGKITSLAIQWLSALILLQSIITNYKLLPNAELDVALGKFVLSLMWFGVCWYIMGNGPDFIHRVGSSFFREFAPDLPSPSGIMLAVSGIAAAMMVVTAAVGVASPVVAQGILCVVIVIVGVSVFFALKLLMLQLELALTVMLAPLNFAFLGLDAMRDQGLAPFRSMISLIYRIVLYGVIFSGYGMVGNAMGTVAQQYSGGDTLSMLTTSGPSTLMTILVAGVFAHIVLAGLLWKSDAIAANLASGSTNLGTADVAGAAMAGAAAGAAIIGMSQVATRSAQSMGDLSKQAGMSMKNASSAGSAEPDAAALKPDLPSSSLAGGTPADAVPGANAASGIGDSQTKPAPSAVSPGIASDSEYGGTPNQLPNTIRERDPARDAAREARRQANQAESQPATISGGPSTGGQRGAGLRGMSEDLRDFHQQVAQERATTHVSINLNHD